MSRIPQSLLSSSPLPHHLQRQASSSASSACSEHMHCGNQPKPQTSRPRRAGSTEEVVAGTHETLAPHNRVPQSVLISFCSLCFLQRSASSTPCNTVMCLQKSTINRLDQQFSTGVPQEFLKHAIPDYSVRGTDLFSLRLSTKKMTTDSTTTTVLCECPVLNN